ncbi:MAG: penicillin-binding protein, partial [Anaerolineae bacterium]|nr:penicillin-binding protein [Anaerolineae bacterium]
YNNIASDYRQQVADLANYRPSFQTVRILDAQGQLLADLTSQDGGDRTPLNSLARISPELIYSVVSVEDERYFENPGYDPISIFRAFVQNIGAGSVVSGASTITQQVASRLILQDSTPTADNKLREIVIASEIARRYSKAEILLLYLNEIPFGNQSFGVEAAAQFYFDKPAAEINLTEGAMLAALIGAPSARNPVTNRSEAFAQTDNALRIIASVPCLNFTEVAGVNGEYCIDRNRILNAQDNFTGQTLVQRAEVQARDYLPRETQIDYPHFVFYVLEELESQFDVAEIYQRGFVVRTTLNAVIQDSAEQALRNKLNTIGLNGANNGAVMVTDPTSGAILAMVGSANFNNPDISGQVNNVFAWNQPGSTIKPVMYAKALDGVGDRNGNGVIDYSEYLTAASILWDVPTQYTDPPYTPVNFDGVYRGPVSVRRALSNSLNVPAVKAFDFIGAEGFVEISRRLGLTFESDTRGEPPVIGRPSAVGATDVRLFDMMQAYGAIANNGVLTSLYSIESVTDSDGNEVPLQGRDEPARALRAQVAFLLQNILSDDAIRAEAFGANSVLNVNGYPGLVGAKTGTTNDIRDLWTMGFARNLVTGVWIGRVDDAPMRNLDSLSTSAEVWNQVMKTALDRRPRPPGFQNPGDIVQLTICDLTGTLPGDNCPGRRNELFAVNQPPPPPEQGIVVSIPIDTWTFRRANDICPDNVEFRTFANVSDPFAIAWLTTTGRQTANLLGLPQDIQTPPDQACDLNTTLPTALLAAPADGATVENVIQITGAVAAPNFARYQLEYAPLSNSNNFVPITGAITEQRPTNGSVLGEWDTRNVPNGDYIIRLAMFATQESGGGYLYRTTRVRVENVLPTATPTPTQPSPTPTAIVPVITDTTVPFPSVTPLTLPTADTFNNQGGGFIPPSVTPGVQLAPGVPTPTISVG